MISNCGRRMFLLLGVVSSVVLSPMVVDGQERLVRGSPGLLAKIQMDAVAKGHSEIAHWGSNPKRYSQWTAHSNRLIPVYTFGTANEADGISLKSYTGTNSAYRDAAKLEKIYGITPRNTVNSAAEYMDQTNIFDLQNAALKAGKKRVILLVFDGMGWEATRAAAMYRSGKVYHQGRGSGLKFQDYTAGGTTEFGLMCTSPATGRGDGIDVSRQLVNLPECTGGYDPSRAGSAPWEKMPDPEYIKGPDHARGAHTFTDSSASATSMCSGIKTYNYAINVAPDGRQAETIAHKAQKLGYKIGVVTSVPVSHATPAAAYAHNVSRKDFQDLTRDMVGLPSASHPQNPLPGVDVLIGAGWGVDDKSIQEKTDEKKAQGKNYVPGPRYLTDADRKAIDMNSGGKYVIVDRTPGQKGSEILRKAGEEAIAKNARLFGMFGIVGLGEGHLPFCGAKGDYFQTPDRSGRTEEVTQADIDENPTLADFTETALHVLSQGDGRFWLMVEAGDVDWAKHANNLDAMVGAIYSGDSAFEKIVQWVEKNGGWNETVLIVTSDHDHYLVLEKPEALIDAPQAAKK